MGVMGVGRTMSGMIDEENEEDDNRTARGWATQASRPRRAAAQQAAQHIKVRAQRGLADAAASSLA